MSKTTDPGNAVREYDDHNTPAFSRLGSPAKVRTLHRALWPPKVSKREEALNVSNELILQALLPLACRPGAEPFRLADMGCGLGGTLFFVLEHFPGPVQGFGLTLSPIQARLALGYLNEYKGKINAFFPTVDTLALPFAASLDAAYEIEAFAHASDPSRFFAEAARCLRPGGRLVMIDDFLTDARPPADLNQRTWLHAYRRGWRVSGLRAMEWVHAEAPVHNLKLVHERSLAPWLRYRTLPAPLTNWVLRVGFDMLVNDPFWPGMLGSLALQHCLKAGVVDYRLLIFEKQA